MWRYFLFLCAPVCVYAQGWTRLPDFPGSKRDDGVMVAVNHKLYAGTGLSEGWWLADDFFELDLATGTWRSLPPPPAGNRRQYACAFAYGEGFFVFGGEGESGPLNDLLRYDVSAENWQPKAPRPGAGVIGPACMAFGDEVIVAGGKTAGPGPASKEVWSYNISTDKWTRKNDFPFAARWRSSATALNGTGYLGFGIDDSNRFYREVYAYDLAADTWSLQTRFPQPGRAYAALQTNGKTLFAIAGIDSAGNCYSDCTTYDPLSETWAAFDPIPAAGRKGGMTAAWGEAIAYVCGIGQSQERNSEAWLLYAPLGFAKNGIEAGMVFPNPVSEFLCIKVAHRTQATLFNASGAPVLDQEIMPGTVIDCRGMIPGIYLLRIGAAQAVRIVKE